MQPKPMEDFSAKATSLKKSKGLHGKKLSKPFLVGMTALVCAACSGRAPETMPTQTSSASAETSNSKEIENCRHLHKVVDRYDLLKQIHDNLDSTCIFDKDPKELERIWGIEIFGVTEPRVVRDKDGVVISDNFGLKTLASPRDQFWVDYYTTRNPKFFVISLTKESLTKGQEFFDQGRFPQFLKTHETISLQPSLVHPPRGWPHAAPGIPIRDGADISFFTMYLWHSAKHGSPVTMYYSASSLPDFYLTISASSPNRPKEY